MVQTETWDTVSAASRSNVQIYSVDPRGLTTMAQEDIEIGGLAPGAYGLGPKQLMQELQTSQENLRMLAEETGGVAFVGRNDFDAAFDRIVQENSAYYVLGYYSTNDRRDGKLRNITVRVAGYPDAQVTYRKRYAAPRGRGPKNTAAGKPLDPSKSLTAELVNTMASPLPKTGLQLRVTAIAKKGTEKNSDVEVLIDTLGGDLTFTEKNGTFNNRLSLSVGVFNKQGKSVFTERPDVDLNLRPESHVRVRENGVRLLRHLSLPPGRYQIRVAAQDSGKVRQGSAHLDLDVPDFTKNPIAISSVALAATADRSVYSPPKPGFDPFNGLLPGPPSALREFPVNSEISAAVEVYDNKPTPTHGIDVTARVKADDGRIVFNKHEERSSEELHGTAGGFGYTFRIPLQGWAPGPLRARSRSEDATQRRACHACHSVRGEVDGTTKSRRHEEARGVRHHVVHVVHDEWVSADAHASRTSQKATPANSSSRSRSRCARPPNGRRYGRIMRRPKKCRPSTSPRIWSLGFFWEPSRARATRWKSSACGRKGRI